MIHKLLNLFVKLPLVSQCLLILTILLISLATLTLFAFNPSAATGLTGVVLLVLDRFKKLKE